MIAPPPTKMRSAVMSGSPRCWRSIAHCYRFAESRIHAHGRWPCNDASSDLYAQDKPGGFSVFTCLDFSSSVSRLSDIRTCRCEGRRLCPLCTGRRMPTMEEPTHAGSGISVTTHLDDDVLPTARDRHWDVAVQWWPCYMPLVRWVGSLQT
jgi:hypothetical protein